MSRKNWQLVAAFVAGTFLGGYVLGAVSRLFGGKR